MPNNFLGKDFLQRIRDSAISRVEQRVKRELAPQVSAPPIGGAPPVEDVNQSFLSRIKDQVKQKVTTLGPVQRRLLDPNATLDEPTIRYRIQYAGQNRQLLLMTYGGSARLVEPYSWRASGKPDHPGGPRTLRFYGYCQLHGTVHSFNPKKIQGLLISDRTFTERWPIEL